MSEQKVLFNHNYSQVYSGKMASSDPLSEERTELLDKKRLDLMDNITVSPRFWAALVKHNTLSGVDARTLKVRSDFNAMYFYWCLSWTL